MSEELTERTLFHLAACEEAVEHLVGEVDEVVGPPNSTWPDLLCAIMEGLERGWVREAHLTREEGLTRLDWAATESGERAFRAFRVRLKRAPIEDEDD